MASTDHEAAAAFPGELKALVEEKGYLPQQVFNADETVLFWKRCPKGLLSQKMKNRLTLLLCGNVAGYKCKPMLVDKSENPHALKEKNKSCLPVVWRSNKRAWVTAKLFED